MSAKPSTKSQADLIQILKARGWKEDQTSHDEYRWYRLPFRAALYTLRGALDFKVTGAKK